MKVAEIGPGSRRIDIELTIVEVGEPRPYARRDGGEGRVATAVGEDETGRIKISLWDGEIDRVSVGSRIKISNGYAKIFRDEVHISAGMYGKLEVIG
ncbi:MAG: DNA-binding protein [Candidatus Hadarchaeales archaeon]